VNLDTIEKKLREAGFFLKEMTRHERMAFGEERVDFCLSAFLGAMQTVDYRLRHEEGALYKPWRRTWDARRTTAELELIKFMVDDRNVEVHASGSSRDVRIEKFAVSEFYDESGMLYAPGNPSLGTSPGTFDKPAYYFTISGTERKAADACGEYWALMARMVADFKADHP
jgi:hypothetical protein